MSPRTTQHADTDLLEAAYRCVLEPEAWADVMVQMKRAFPSSAQTFYFLHRDTGHLRPVSLAGIDTAMLRHVDTLYFARDNPWMRVSHRLHRPGVVRTNERLEALLGRAGDLYRSAYYHEWMKPQGLHFTMGNTLLAEGELMANVTLMRPPDMRTFDAAEVRRFEAISRHLQRALQAALALDRDATANAAPALDALPSPVALVRPDLSLVHANAAMETLLRAGRGLAARAGQLAASDPAAQRRLAAAVREARATPADVRGDALRGDAERSDAAATPVWLPQADGGDGLWIDVAPVAVRPGRYLPAQPLVLLVARRLPRAGAAHVAQVLRDRHGCTRSEAALALQLARGERLSDAAAACKLTYGSARVYLKTLFHKLDVHSQAQLVALLARMGGCAAADPDDD
jgi:DNA-binding CsgD family transcriptional regulator